MKTKTSFFFRLFLGNLLLVVVLIAIGRMVSYHYLREQTSAETQRSQYDMLHMARFHFESRWPLSTTQIQADCRRLTPRGEAFRITVVAPDGTVLGDSSSTPANMENHKTKDRPELLAALAGRAETDIRQSETLGVDFRYIAQPILHHDDVVAAVRIAMPLHVIAQRRSFIRAAIYWGIGSTLVAAVGLGLMMSWLWHRPLREITITARRLASGDLTQRAPVHGAAELEELSTALNDMRRTVSNQLNLISAQRENLQTILRYLRECVIALDDAGRIRFMNPAAAELFAPDHPETTGQHLQSVIRVAEIVDAFNELIEGCEQVARDVVIELRGKRYTLAMHASRIAADDESGISVLIVVRDITDLARTASMKAEFVANASHELRTPLGTLRAAVDSLDGLEPTDQDALEKIRSMLDRHVARLEGMTNDLLDLHTVESTPLGGQSRQPIELDDLLAHIRAGFGDRADEKEIQLQVETDAPGETVHSDRKLIDMVAQNLVDNALKFTPPGGRVRCDLDADLNQSIFTIRVSDTGCGIAADDQAKVFDRFFQVEASRTGDNRVRGTGLGLAIVKHAVDRLGGKVTLQSTLGQGTTVTVSLPIS